LIRDAHHNNPQAQKETRMNRNKLLMAVATAALVLGTSGAFAQEPSRSNTPAVDRNVPAEKVAPAMKGNAGAMQQKAPESKGEAPALKSEAPAGAMRNGAAENNERGATEKKSVAEEKNQKAGEEKRSVAEEKNPKAGEEKGKQNGRVGETEQRGKNEPATTGQGAAPNKGSNAKTAVNLSGEQRTKIHDVIIKDRSAPRVDHVDFSLSVGTAVPRSVKFVTVPQTIVEIQPEWRGFDYFLVGDQIVIVDPSDMQIVAIIDA
jgi:hypothetical protein